MALELIEKKRLDEKFSVLNSLSPTKLQNLGEGYEKLKLELLRVLVDIDDRAAVIKMRLGSEQRVS